MARESPKIVAWSGTTLPSEQEAEAWLSREGYEAFRWHDVPGSSYPPHRHPRDECLWILQGEIAFTISGAEHVLKAGDRLYLPAGTPHTARVPGGRGCVYLVGRK